MAVSGKGLALVQRFSVRTSRTGDEFATMRLNLGKDASFGTIEAKIWQLARFNNARRPLPDQGTLIEAEYTADEYQGAPQWSIKEFRIIEGPERAKLIEKFTPGLRIDTAYYQAKLEQLISEADPKRAAAQILTQVFDRAEFREAFCRAPAAVSHHQNYPGGLLEHTLNVTTLALALADAYGPEGLSMNQERLPVDRTLLIAAGLLHDIGKIDTYKFEPLSTVTDLNSFEGHLPISYAIVRELVRPLRVAPPYPEAVDELDKLLNCILSHHGTLEFGSPVTPACIEAVLLSMADVTDARMASILTEGNNLRRQNPGARWLKHVHFPGGIFVGDWPQPGKI